MPCSWVRPRHVCDSKYPDDEHRAMYVGLTRTKNRLCLSDTDHRYNKQIMKRDEVLDKAKEIIGGPRAEEYGDAFENFTHARGLEHLL